MELREVPAPTPAAGEVAVRVRATAVNRADLLQRMGLYGAPPGAPQDIPGLEFAGEVEEVGPHTTLAKGTRVYGLAGGGTYAERVVVHERTLAPIPDGLDFVRAAAIPEAFVTAYDAMVTQGRLEAGETVLVHAVGSGVGTAAVQIARAIGARAIGTARSEGKLERAKALGMAQGIVPAGGKFAAAVRQATGGRGVDMVLELVGGGYVAEDVSCAAPRARIMLVGLMAGPRADLDLGPVLHKRITLIGTVLRARPLEEKIAAGQLLARHVSPLVASGALVPVVDKVLPLEKAAAAHEYVGANEGFGKVVLEL
jgi:putative PIG3 family NAD(P)H quinone oxidoreductase